MNTAESTATFLDGPQQKQMNISATEQAAQRPMSNIANVYPSSSNGAETFFSSLLNVGGGGSPTGPNSSQPSPQSSGSVRDSFSMFADEEMTVPDFSATLYPSGGTLNDF